MVTSRRCILNFKLDEFFTSRTIKWTFHTKSTSSEWSRLIKILDPDYKSTSLDEIVGQTDNLDQEQKSLRILLNKYRELFDGTLGYFNIPPIKFEKRQERSW